MSEDQALRCAQHGAAAGWQCTVCHQALCPDCAALKSVSPVTLLACGLCGELAEPLLRKKGEAISLARRVVGSFIFPLRGEALAAWLGISLWLWATSALGSLGSLIGWGAALASLFGVTRSTARGGDRLELSDFQDLFHSVAAPMLRFAVATLPAWGGALLLLNMDSPERWWWWVVFLIAALWVPSAFIGAATGASLVHLINPLRVLGATARIGKDFGIYVGGLLLVGVTMLLSFPLAMLLGSLPLPFFAGVLSNMVLVFPFFVAARVAGQVLLLHGPAFGWGDELDRYEPVLQDTPPRGELPQRSRSLPRHLPASIELEPESPSERSPPQAANRFSAIEVNPHSEPPPEVAPLDVTLLPSFGEQSAASIREAIAEGRTDVALDAFRATGRTAVEQLSFEELVWVGQAATSHIDYESAELAFIKACERAAGAEAMGRARVLLARLLGERLNRRDEAHEWMRRILSEQAGTSAAKYAQNWLSRAE